MPLIEARAKAFAWAFVLLLAAGVAQAAPVGKVVFASGVASAQRAGEPARLLGRDVPIEEGDVISTSARGFVILEFKDGGKMTLRPNTVFGVDQYAHDAGEENALLRLFKGGLRAVTGLIGKRNPHGYKLHSQTGTIGIRGTDFDARVCDKDCAEDLKRVESQAAPAVPAQPVARAVARAVLVRGHLVATAENGSKRTLVTGGPVYQGDTLATERDGFAVLAFRDNSRVTLQPETEFKVERYRWEPEQADPGNVLFRLVKGGLRAVTGLLGKRAPQAYALETPTATIGIRGTGFDAIIANGLYVSTWDGVVEMRLPGGVLTISKDQVGFVATGATTAVLLPGIPLFIQQQLDVTPRPDGVDVDPQQLFGTEARDMKEPGIYVLVREGHVELVVDGQRLDLGAGESGLIDPLGREVVRLDLPPPFLEQDPYPRPDQFDEGVRRLIELIKQGSERPGEGPPECELR